MACDLHTKVDLRLLNQGCRQGGGRGVGGVQAPCKLFQFADADLEVFVSYDHLRQGEGMHVTCLLYSLDANNRTL